MAGIRLELQTPNAKKIRLGFMDFAREVAEIRPFLFSVIGALEAYNAELFDSEGATGSKKWKALHPVTQIIRRQKALDPKGPILEETGRLREALTSSANPYAVRAVGEEGSLVFGTKGVPYASHHQFGTKQRGVTKKQQGFLRFVYGVKMKRGHVITMPPRPPLDLAKGKNLHPTLEKRFIEAGRVHLIAARRNSPSLPQDWDRKIEQAFDLEIDAKE